MNYAYMDTGWISIRIFAHFPRFETLQNIQTRRYRNYDRDSNGYRNDELQDGAQDDSQIPDHLKEATMESIFGSDDTVDLTPGFVSDRYPASEYADGVPCDHLVIIGRKSRVDLCIFMIEMALDSFTEWISC